MTTIDISAFTIASLCSAATLGFGCNAISRNMPP